MKRSNTREAQFKKGTIKHLQKYVSHKMKERGFDENTIPERLLMLVEELGELIQSMRKVGGLGVDVKKEKLLNTSEELADMINVVFGLAIKLGIDLEKEFLKKEKIIDKRKYKRYKKQ